MPLRQKLTAQALLLWRFLGFFQPPTLRLLHAVAAVLVILQFCTKLFGFGYGHVVLGLILCWVGFALVVWSLKTRGLRHYFPYLWGDMDQLKKDLAQLRGGKRIIAPRAKGLATVVQGLGLGALSMSLLSGLWMYVAWPNGNPAPGAAAVHGIFVWLLLGDVLGHGGMALAHFFFWKKSTVRK